MFYDAIKTTKMMDGVYEMKEFNSVTLWLLEGNDKCLLIDTGMGLADLPATIRGITGKPVAVVNSHIHIDHIGGRVNSQK
jgi:glyoxylase-like metal-dependent hydrolase (beta-lactamase superfamily II)